MEAYFDNSATTRPCPEAVKAVQVCLEEKWYNPSALYKPALEAEKAMQSVRDTCLKAVCAEGQRLIFTGSGTEADNLAMLGHLRTVKKQGRVLLLSVEHPALLSCVPEIEKMGHQVELIPVDREGRADLSKLEEMLDENVIQLTLMQVNNETGAIQPLREVVALRDRLCPEAKIHVDGVQGFLRVPFDFRHSGVQSYAFSGHKIHAVKGIGGLILADDLRISPLVFGGGQENGYRSGTENMPGIMALGAAVKRWNQNDAEKIRKLKMLLLNELCQSVPELKVNGPDPGNAELSAPHILNVSMSPVRSQTMLFALEGDGIYVSAGSACSSKKQKISPVLKAMGVRTQDADCALRFSLSPFTTEDEIRYAASCVGKQYQILKKYVRR